LFPQERLYVLLLVIPVTMMADTVLWLMVILSVVGLSDVFKDGIAHAAHLGGIVTGIWFGKLFLRKVRPPGSPKNPSC
jgi:membrane associated rhomboid family serine protease